MKRWAIRLAATALLAGAALAKSDAGNSMHYVPATVLSTADPVYPFTSIAEGTVLLQVTLGASGKIERVEVLHDIKSLTPEAEKAVKQWTFRPALLDGKQVRSILPVAFTFRSFWHRYR